MCVCVCVCVCDYTSAAARAFILQDRRDTVKHQHAYTTSSADNCVSVWVCVTILVPLQELLSCRTEETQLQLWYNINSRQPCVCVCVCVINTLSHTKVPSFSYCWEIARFDFRELLKASDASSGVSYVKSAVQC